MDIITEQQNTPRRNILMNLLDELGFQSIKSFQASQQLAVDGLAGRITYNALHGVLLRVVELQDFAGFYFAETFPKRQIVWHHSAGWDDARGMYDWWKNDGARQVATAVGIENDGTIFRGFNEQYWAHHLGMKHVDNVVRNQQSVAVEICNWGGLTEKDFQLYSWADVPVNRSETIRVDYRGYQYFEIYTSAEINTLKYWTLLNALRFGIPVAYREQDMWQVSQNAINGVPGLYTHGSYVSWKSDVAPQPNLIAMAKGLAVYER
ncbi:MAG: hypothetical protein ACFB0B_11830 [Thermonemataceae bacterium]